MHIIVHILHFLMHKNPVSSNYILEGVERKLAFLIGCRIDFYLSQTTQENTVFS